MTELLVYGAGGHARVVADVARACGHGVAGFVVDDGFPMPATVDDCPVWAWRQVRQGAFALGIGDNHARAASAARLQAAGLAIVTLVHARAIVARSAHLGAGAVVMAGGIVNPGGTIGEGAVVNTGAIVEHDCEVGRYALLGPNSALGGGASVGDHTLVGIGAAVRPGVRIGARVVVGAGAVVVADVGDDLVVTGVPARPR